MLKTYKETWKKHRFQQIIPFFLLKFNKKDSLSSRQQAWYNFFNKNQDTCALQRSKHKFIYYLGIEYHLLPDIEHDLALAEHSVIASLENDWRASRHPTPKRQRIEKEKAKINY